MKILKIPTIPQTLDSRLVIEATDEVQGKAAHSHYQIFGKTQQASQKLCDIRFQNGPLTPKDDPNGISVESLLQVSINRLEEFQKGDFPCEENDEALRKLREALHWLNARTLDRVSRGVEGSLRQ